MQDTLSEETPLCPEDQQPYWNLNFFFFYPGGWQGLWMGHRDMAVPTPGWSFMAFLLLSLQKLFFECWLSFIFLPSLTQRQSSTAHSLWTRWLWKLPRHTYSFQQKQKWSPTIISTHTHANFRQPRELSNRNLIIRKKKSQTMPKEHLPKNNNYFTFLSQSDFNQYPCFSLVELYKSPFITEELD